MDLFLNIEFHDIRSFVMNPLSNEKIEDNSKLKQYADDTYIVNHNVKFVNHRVEKNVGKGENAGDSIFSFSHYVFKTNFLTVVLTTLYYTIPTFNDPGKEALWKHFGKINQHFLLFPQCFLPLQNIFFKFSLKFILTSANAFNLVQSKLFVDWEGVKVVIVC